MFFGYSVNVGRTISFCPIFACVLFCVCSEILLETNKLKVLLSKLPKPTISVF